MGKKIAPLIKWPQVGLLLTKHPHQNSSLLLQTKSTGLATHKFFILFVMDQVHVCFKALCDKMSWVIPEEYLLKKDKQDI